MSSMNVGERVVLRGLNATAYNGHTGLIVRENSATRLGVQIFGTEKCISVHKSNCANVVPQRSPNDLIGELKASFVIFVLSRCNSKTFIPEVLEKVLAYLKIQNVNSHEVRATSCTSEGEPAIRYSYKKECSLEAGKSSCWISRDEQGPEPEHIVYSIGPCARRVDYVSLCIPILPHGPLSVRKFQLEYFIEEDDLWIAKGEYVYFTLDQEGLQEFAVIPPIESRFIRLICLENAHGDERPIGFWYLNFA
eukprot:gene27250-33556_t